MEINILKDFTSNDIDDLQKLDLQELMQIRNNIMSLSSKFDSGHEYIHGVNNVESFIDDMIEMKPDLSFAKDMNVSIAGNGSLYDKNVKGVIPDAMEMLFNYRKELKTKMKNEYKILEKKKEKLEALMKDQ